MAEIKKLFLPDNGEGVEQVSFSNTGERIRWYYDFRKLAAFYKVKLLTVSNEPFYGV